MWVLVSLSGLRQPAHTRDQASSTLQTASTSSYVIGYWIHPSDKPNRSLRACRMRIIVTIVIIVAVVPPAKRKAATASSSSKAAGPRQSKLAKENNITAQEEAEIKEAFSLFAEPMDGEKEGVIPIGDVRRAMIALGISPKTNHELREFTSILDPEDEGFATYPSFLAICAIKLSSRDRTSEAHMREVDEAFALFVGRSVEEIEQIYNDDHDNEEEEEYPEEQQEKPVITLAHLKRVAAVLKEENVTDELLRDMILEANGGAGVGRGVRREEFDGVMRRAGVWR
ncbi:hypothetical protein SMACR_02598 [Sordaria macrospora]|uniref:Calmodulin n=2 Tax=Sordaria macrospora TaxID=5147 RepID=F7VWX8_SORMK|nr:uncharacterized protein SMAC_02598 [Sordaria macrospora k-hell]KAA8636464.1 hypothetical protein SMACR_02598 [Sordaria macrospora]WPJ60574.1 hypothetical protein SMAC4_02598 [Sordaria macrospora]CCC10019.1 unnamed protein product [Sordaria macrospora k-hell]